MRTAADGNIAKLVFFCLAFVAFIGVGTWYDPFARGYEVKNAAKIACNELATHTRLKFPGPSPWREKFLRAATGAGAQLKPEQYSITVEEDRANNRWLCKVKVDFPTTTEWILVGDVLKLPPLKLMKKLRFVHEVRNSY